MPIYMYLHNLQTHDDDTKSFVNGPVNSDKLSLVCSINCLVSDFHYGILF